MPTPPRAAAAFDPVAHFEQHFEVLPVRDEAARREVFGLRYAVYCEELGYEDPSAFPDRLEHDDFDSDSEFALLRHRASGRAAGCVRLILGTEARPFPFERVCAGFLDPRQVDPATLDRAHAGEISRLAVHRDFRRRAGELVTPDGVGDPADSAPGARRHPLLAMGLFLAASALGLNRGLDQVLVMMEPRLARLLASCGIRFTPVGQVIDYHGKRGPYRIKREELLGALDPHSRALLEHMLERLR
jgi:N-acyl amino acid synthase of PEP-CTERM/exosortase system